VNPIDYLHLQLRLEGKSVIGEDRLRQVEEVPGEEVPLVLLARFADGNLVAYFDEILHPDLQGELDRQIPRLDFPHVDPLLDFLQEQNLPVETGHYKTYLLPTRTGDFEDKGVDIRSREDPIVQAFGFGGFAEEVYTIEREGSIASACVPVRENDFCGEAWLYTDPAFRRLGLARLVVGAWARGMSRKGKVPFYSHKLENTASAHLGARLGLEPVFDEIVISYMNV
jgi:hypothetical protein